MAKNSAKNNGKMWLARNPRHLRCGFDLGFFCRNRGRGLRPTLLVPLQFVRNATATTGGRVQEL